MGGGGGGGGAGGGGTPPESPGGGDGDGGGGDGMGMMQGMEGVVIWGTNVNVKESMARFREFLLEFCLADEDEPLYKSQMEEIYRTHVSSVLFSHTLYHGVIIA